MPRPLPQKNRLLAPVSLLVLLMLVFVTGIEVNAQKGRKRPASGGAAQRQGNANTTTAQQKPPKKNITPLHSGDTSEGSRITITSDAPLNDYSAYRSGDRYYVVIPEANAPRAQAGLRGRGFEDVQVQKKGDDAVLSFKLQPGTNARVSQRFNRLDVELTTPGGGARVPTVTPTPAPTPAIAAQPTPRATPPTQIVPGTGITGQARTVPQQNNPGVANPAQTPQTNGANPAVVYAPTPETAASPGNGSQANAQANTAATPASEVVAQAQQPPAQESATSNASSGTTFGAYLQRNWLLVLLGALVLLTLVVFVAARSRAQRTSSTTPVRRPERKEKRAATGEKAVARLKDADISSAVTAASSAPAVAASEPEVSVEEIVAPIAAAEAVKAVEVDEAPAVVSEETVETEGKPVAALEETVEEEAVPAVNVERVEVEVKNALTGESYDEEVVGASDARIRQLVATELLSALAARNVTRRERARDVFVKHNYLDEATKNLRTAEAPAERAAAARALGYVKDKSTTPHLVAALEDEAPEVRRASVEALAELRDPSARESLSQLLEREKDRKVPKNLIRRAIEASAAVEEETPTLEAEPSSSSAADLAGLALAGGGLIAALPVDEEVETSEDERAAQREAEEEASRRREEEEARRLAEEERARAEEARRQAEEEEARLQAEAEAKRLAEEEARLRAEEEARAEEARLRAEAEAKRLAEEEEARRQEEEAARLRAEEEARQKAEEEARLEAEAEARREAEAEAARLRAEEEARLKLEAEERQRAEEAARLKAEEEERARLKAEEEERQRREAEARRKAEEEAQRVRAEAEAKRKAEEARLLAEAEAERKRVEEEARQKAEEERLRAEEAERLRLEEEARQREEEEARRRAEEESERKHSEEARLLAEAEAERQRQAEEEARLEAEAEARREAEAEAARLRAEEEAERQRAEEEARRHAEEIAAAEALRATPPPSLEALLERNDGTSAGWVDVDTSMPEVAHHTTPPQLIEESAIPELTHDAIVAESVVQESKEIAPSDLSLIEEPVAAGRRDNGAAAEKGIATLDEFSTVPGAILKRLSSEEPSERAAAVSDLARVGGDDSFREISAAFDDPSVEVRNAAARSLFNLNADRAATFTRALREAPPERRRKIGSALSSSGLASEAIGQLMGESREKTYDAFSLLFLMSKAGEVQPLMRAIEEHPNNEVRLAVVKLLALSGQQEILPAFRRLAVRGSLPTEVRSAVMEAIYQISSQSPTAA